MLKRIGGSQAGRRAQCLDLDRTCTGGLILGQHHPHPREQVGYEQDRIRPPRPAPPARSPGCQSGARGDPACRRWIGHAWQEAGADASAAGEALGNTLDIVSGELVSIRSL
jgi:hypothetical protein